MDNEFMRRLMNPDKPVICIGQWYDISFVNGEVTEYKKLKAVGKYEHHVLFENEKGYRESLSWWQLARCVK